MKQESSNELIHALSICDNNTERGYLLNELLERFHRGFPAQNLLALFNSSDKIMVQNAAWITSELGTKACVIFNEIEHFIKSRDPKVRFYMASCILVCANNNNAKSILELMSLLEDEASFVRWKAMDCLCKLTNSQVESVIQYIRENKKHSKYASGLSYLYDYDKGLVDFENIKFNIREGDPITKKIAVIATVRKVYSPSFLREISLLSEDSDIIDFCRDFT